MKLAGILPACARNFSHESAAKPAGSRENLELGLLEWRSLVATVMPVTLQTPEWPNLHAGEVRKLSTLLEASQALSRRSTRGRG